MFIQLVKYSKGGKCYRSYRSKRVLLLDLMLSTMFTNSYGLKYCEDIPFSSLTYMQN